MTLIVILMSYFAMQEAWIPGLLRDRRWVQAYISQFDRLKFLQSLHPALAYGLFLLLPMLAVWYLDVVLKQWLFVLLDAVLSLLLLCSALGSRRLLADFKPFLNRWQNQQWQAAYEYGARLFNYSKTISTSDLLSQTSTQFMLRMNQLLFAPVLWFVIFGVAGLVLYIFTLVVAESVEAESAGVAAWKKLAAEFMHALEGLPARVMALSIALLFMSKKAVAVAVRRFRITDREAEIVLKLAVKMALNFKELPDDQEVLASEGVRRINVLKELCSNIFFMWLILIGLGTLLGWLL